MQSFFGRGGPLARSLPSFESRLEQAALAQAIADALEREEHLLAEAGTGTGKSLAYLVPALLSGKRVVVATATKALQEQLLGKDVPAAAAALGRPVDVAVLKGRQNYLCVRSLEGFELLGSSLFADAEDGRQFEALRPWLEGTQTGDRSELPFEPSASLWTELAVGADRCLGRRCPAVSRCFSERARERAGKAELVIVNHALYFADLAMRADGDGTAILPEHDAVVFDEAHRLEEAATTWFGGRLTLAGLRQLARDVERACREAQVDPPGRALAELDRFGERLLAELVPERGRRRLRERELTPALPLAAGLVDGLERLAVALEGQREELDALARRSRRVACTVESCLEESPFERVVWAEPGAVQWAPLDIASALEETLWAGGPTAILVSATLEPAFLRDRLGLREARELVLASPFDYREQALLYVPPRAPEPRSSGYAAWLLDEVAALCRSSRGRALVLTSSYRALDELADGLRELLAYPVLRQGEAPRERLLERFREEVDSVLVATQTFWQGVDIQGESLSLLVIDKLPFAAPGEPLVEARCERIAHRGGDWFGQYALPTAILQLRQGCGRLIRSGDDRGVVAILDARLRTRAYGARFLEALPPAPLVADRAAVDAFFAPELGALTTA